MTQNHSNIDMDMNIDTFRGRPISSNNKTSRESFIYSNAFSIPYFKRIEIQNDNSLWSKQVKQDEIKEINISYTTFSNKVGILVK